MTLGLVGWLISIAASFASAVSTKRPEQILVAALAHQMRHVHTAFDHRCLLAGGWSFDPNFRVELGYMNQHLDSAAHQEQTMHNLIMGSLFINF